MAATVVTDKARVAIEVDQNADQLTVAETDASANWIRSWRVPLVACGKSRRQAQAISGDPVGSMVEYARNVGKPAVMEELAFRQKKASLDGESPHYSRMLAFFSYGRVRAHFLFRGIRQGVEVHQVSPVFISVIGRVRFTERYGLSVPQEVAPVQARR